MSDLRCLLCPKECVLGPGQRGDCRVRVNWDGKLVTLVYGKLVSANAHDPVEKKPLFHFLPGTRCFSIATAGCNLHCKFCQNYSISQLDPEDAGEVFDVTPDQLVQAAVRSDCRSIAYTYSDPSIFFEFTRDAQTRAREARLRNILVTAGYLNEGPTRELCQNADAANVDLKSFSDDFYRNVCGATLEPVLHYLEIMAKEGVWVEVTNLVVPTLNDDLDLIKRMSNWMVEKLGPHVPLHFSRFHPMYRLTRLPPTPAETLVRARDAARGEGLQFVYVGNVEVPGGGDTICPSCGKPVITRAGYTIPYFNLKDGKCGACGAVIPGVWK